MAQATITVTIEGTAYPAMYELKRGVVTVRTDIGTNMPGWATAFPIP